MGNQVLYNNTSFGNSVVGQSALLENISGYYNTAMGAFTLISNQSGSSNAAFGKTALHDNIGGSSNTALGQDPLYTNTYGNNNTAVGEAALYGSSGSNNTALGYNALSNTITGSNNLCLGYNAQVPNASASNQVRIGDAGIAYAAIQVTWTITSDRRWKADIKNSDLGLGFINTLRPVSYYRNNDESKKLEYGFIAQEVEDALNHAGVKQNGIISKDDEGMYGMRYNDLMAPVVKAIQE